MALVRLEEGLDAEERRADLARVEPARRGPAVIDQPAPFEPQEQPKDKKDKGRQTTEDPEESHGVIVPEIL